MGDGEYMIPSKKRRSSGQLIRHYLCGGCGVERNNYVVRLAHLAVFQFGTDDLSLLHDQLLHRRTVLHADTFASSSVRDETPRVRHT